MCVCVHASICVHVCVCARAFKCAWACVCVHASIHRHVSVCVCVWGGGGAAISTSTTFTSPVSHIPDYCVHVMVIISFCVSIMCLCLDSRTLLT